MGYTMSRYFVPGVGELPAALIAGGDERSVVDALKSAKTAGAALAAIVPSGDEDFDAYRRLGFADFFMIERSSIKLKLLGAAEEKIIDLPPERAAECNAQMFEVARWRGHMMRTDEMWRAAVDGEIARGGGMLACERDGKLAGYAFFRPSDGRAVIDELFCEDESAFIALQRAAIERVGAEEGILCAPACPHGAERFGMVRAIDCAALLECAVKRRPGDIAIEVEDEELGVSARYAVSDGKVQVGKRQGQAALQPGEFAAIILGGGPAPYMNMVFC